MFRPPNDQRDSYIKRIIGLPGELVEVRDGAVYIHQKDGNIERLYEPYVQNIAARDYQGDTIPRDEYFVLGDNRNNTNDSRNGWTVPRQNIIGKAWLSIWPPDEWGLAANYSLQGQIASATND